MKNLKFYIEIPCLSEYSWNKKKEYLPLIAGTSFSWGQYDFELCSDNSYFPKGRKDGNHKFTLQIGFMYWSIKFIWYKPKQ